MATCSQQDARSRLRRAEEFLAAARLVLDEPIPEAEDAINLSGVSAALAVLAGIAASDAATCHRFRQRARGQDHREAIELLRSIEPRGKELANDLERLLDLKDNAHYGVLGVSSEEAARAVDRAVRMAARAREVLESG